MLTINARKTVNAFEMNSVGLEHVFFQISNSFCNSL